MVITVHLHTVLARQTEKGLLNQVEVEVAEGTTLADLLSMLEIRLSVDDLLLVVNGHNEELSYLISEGDDIHFIPALSGG